MTAIAGLVGAPSAGTLERECRTSLDALSLYGSRTSLRCNAIAAFGINLHELLPEDRFDTQPYADERFLLAADIRIDNRADVLAALGAASAGAGCSDAEILFQAWRRWHERCLDLIVGDYAFAIHDNWSGKLFLVRDPLGQRPLFYQRSEEVIVFASMPSGILRHGRLAHDRVGIAQRLAAQEQDSRRSYFEGVTRVLSGEMVVVSPDGVTSTMWTPQTDELAGTTRDELVDELRATLDNAVGARMRRIAGPIATQLSSGYDSSSVTASAARMSGGGDLVAYTSAPARGRDTVMVRGRIADESDIAGQTARFLGIEHEIIRTEQPLLDSLRGHARYYQEPVRNVLNVGWWSEIDRRAAERGATVLLTGEVGNLTFSAGGLSALSDWVRKRQLRRWWSEALSASRRRDVRWRGILMSSFRFLLPKRVTEELIRLFLAQPRWSTACFVRSELLSRLPDLRPAQPDRQAEERLRVMRGYDAGVVRTGTLAKYGIDERDPTADRRLVEFSLRLPPEHLLDRGTYKPLARAVLADRVPALVLDAPLRGYQGADWISRISKADALSTLEEISSNSTVHEVIDIERLRRTISNWPIAAANQPDGSIESFGRHVTNALSMGVFVIESEDHGTLGV